MSASSSSSRFNEISNHTKYADGTFQSEHCSYDFDIFQRVSDEQLIKIFSENNFYDATGPMAAMNALPSVSKCPFSANLIIHRREIQPYRDVAASPTIIQYNRRPLSAKERFLSKGNTEAMQREIYSLRAKNIKFEKAQRLKKAEKLRSLVAASSLPIFSSPSSHTKTTFPSPNIRGSSSSTLASPVKSTELGTGIATPRIRISKSMADIQDLPLIALGKFCTQYC